MNSSVAYWFGALPFNLGIVGSSPDSAERQFIFIFLGWPTVLLLLHMVCYVEKTTT